MFRELEIVEQFRCILEKLHGLQVVHRHVAAPVQHSEYELAHERLEGGLQFIIFIERYVLLVVTADEVGLFALKFLDEGERGLYQLVGTEFDF